MGEQVALLPFVPPLLSPCPCTVQDGRSVGFGQQGCSLGREQALSGCLRISGWVLAVDPKVPPSVRRSDHCKPGIGALVVGVYLVFGKA